MTHSFLALKIFCSLFKHGFNIGSQIDTTFDFLLLDAMWKDYFAPNEEHGPTTSSSVSRSSLCIAAILLEGRGAWHRLVVVGHTSQPTRHDQNYWSLWTGIRWLLRALCRSAARSADLLWIWCNLLDKRCSKLGDVYLLHVRLDVVPSHKVGGDKNSRNKLF